MAEVPKVLTYRVDLSGIQLRLIQDSLAMMKTSALRALDKEPDEGIREARRQRAAVIAALEVHVMNVSKV